MVKPEKKEQLVAMLKKLGGKNTERFTYSELRNEIDKINSTVVEKTSKNDNDMKFVQRKIDLATKAYESKLVNFRKDWDMNLNQITENIKRVDGGIQSKALDVYNNSHRRFYTNGFQIANTFPSINFIPDPAATGITITSRNNPATKCTDLFFGTNLVIPSVRWMKDSLESSIDGVNKVFELSRTPLTNSVDFVVNGQVYTEGVDYTISGTTITTTSILPIEMASFPVVAKYMY